MNRKTIQTKGVRSAPLLNPLKDGVQKSVPKKISLKKKRATRKRREAATKIQQTEEKEV